MSYPKKTYSLAQTVIDEIANRVSQMELATGKKFSPNQLLTALLWPKRRSSSHDAFLRAYKDAGDSKKAVVRNSAQKLRKSRRKL